VQVVHRTGFSSVMIDGSHHPFDKNIEETRKWWNTPPVRRHRRGELGVLAGIEDDVIAASPSIPSRRRGEVRQGHRGGLAGHIHRDVARAYKFKPSQCTRNAKGVLEPPPLRFDILEEIEKRIPGFPIVLHGGLRSCSST